MHPRWVPLKTEESMYKIVNLTPHAIVLVRSKGSLHGAKTTYPPSGDVARVATITREVGTLGYGERGGVALLKQEFGEVQGLPESKSNTLYIVSGLVRAACPDRWDIASPGSLVRDEDGRVIGCEGFVVN
jgi:hypothetical protein